MNPLAALLRKQILESLWLLGILGLVLFAFAVFVGSLTLQAQQELERLDPMAMMAMLANRGGPGGPPGPPPSEATKSEQPQEKQAGANGNGNPRRPRGILGLFRFFGGSNMDFSTLAMETAWFNHPLILITFLGLGIARGSSAVSSEIEKGLLDLTLSRPISRSLFLFSQILGFLIILTILVAMFVGGLVAGNIYYGVKSPPSPLSFLTPATMLIALSASVYGTTVPFSAWDVNRWRPAFIGMAALIGGLIGYLYSFDERYKDLEKLSVLRAYTPVTATIAGENFAFNAGILGVVFGVGVFLAFLIFTNRDLPANS